MDKSFLRSGAVRPVQTVLVALGLALSTWAPAPLAAQEEVRLTVLATSDFHGALESTFEEPESGRVLGGAAALASILARETARNPEGTVLVDAGDVIHGSALSNLTQGRTSIDLFNLLEPDAVVVGNHEFDWGVDNLLERMEQASFPMLLANVEEKETGRPPPWARSHEVVRRRGVRIGLVGVVTETLARETLPQYVEDYLFTDPVAAAERLVDRLLPDEADLVVVICHCGLSPGDVFGTELKEMAARVPNVAAFVGGHTHERHAESLSGVPVVQPGYGGRYVGRLDLTFDRDSRKVLDREVSLVPVYADEVAADPEVLRRLEAYRSDVESILSQEIGTAAVELDRDPNGECRLGNLLTDVIRERFGADVALQNSLGVRAPIPAGTIRYGDVYRALPFDNTIVLFELTGVQVERLLAEADADHRLLYASGLEYVVDHARSAGERVQVVTELEPDRTYKVAVNNYMAQGGDNLTSLKELGGGTDTGVLLRDVLADWIRGRDRAGEAVRAELDGRIEIRR